MRFCQKPVTAAFLSRPPVRQRLFLGLRDRPQPRQTGNASAAAGAAFGTYPLFAASVVYVLPFYFMMTFFPRHARTRALLSSPGTLLPLACVYFYLLVASWQPDTLQLMMPGDIREGFKGFNPQFFPELQAIQTLFSRVTTAASLWVHIIAVNFFFARTVFLEGLAKGLPTWHSCILAMVLGPVALISAAVTEALCHKH